MVENLKGPNVLSYLQGRETKILIIGQREDSKCDISSILDELASLKPHLYLEMDVASYIVERKVIGPNFAQETYRKAHSKGFPIHACTLDPSPEVDYLLYKEIKRSYLRNFLQSSHSPISLLHRRLYTTEFSELYTIARITKNTTNRVKCAVIYVSSLLAIRLARRLTKLGFIESAEYSQRNEVDSIRVKELLWEIL